MRKLNRLSVVIACSIVLAVSARAEEVLLPDLTKFGEHYLCRDIKAQPPKILQDNYKRTVAEYREYVFLTTIVETGVQFMQFVQYDPFAKRVLNKKTEWGQLFAKIDGKWQEVTDTRLYLQLIKRHIPNQYLGEGGHLLFSKEHFVCN